MTWPFGDLRPLSYGVILADPPWHFELRSEAGEGKSPQAHYDCMDLDAIKALPVGQLAGGDCLLLLWATWPMLRQAQDVMDAWGFRYTTGGTWGKTTATGKIAFGTGYVLRSACEPFLIGTIGHPRCTRGERNLILAERREHSRKPDEIHAMLERLVPDASRRAELFARSRRPGWDAWGDQADRFAEAS